MPREEKAVNAVTKSVLFVADGLLSSGFGLDSGPMSKIGIAILGGIVVNLPIEPKKYVRLDLVNSTQEYLNRDRLAYYVKRKRLPAILLDGINGRYHIRNGHHRAVPACLKGRIDTLAKVLKPKEPERSLLLAAWGLL
jgi:hypothetical protein